MEFKGKGHEFRCVPSVLGIRDQYEAYLENVELAKETNGEPPEKVEPVMITLTGVTQPEWDRQTAREQELAATFAITERLDKLAEITKELVEKHFVKVEGLVIDGSPVESFNEFYENAPPELVQWVLRAVFSTEILSTSELKN